MSSQCDKQVKRSDLYTSNCQPTFRCGHPRKENLSITRGSGTGSVGGSTFILWHCMLNRTFKDGPTRFWLLLSLIASQAKFLEGFPIHHVMIRSNRLVTRLARARCDMVTALSRSSPRGSCSWNAFQSTLSFAAGPINSGRPSRLFSSLSPITQSSIELESLDLLTSSTTKSDTDSLTAQQFIERDESLSASTRAVDDAGAAVDSPSTVETQLESMGIKSRPRPGGMWNVKHPDWWYRRFGSRSPEYLRQLEPLIRLQPGDPDYFDVSDLKLPFITIVRTVADARIVMERLMNADPSVFHACDTEVMDIDLKTVGPVGNGYVTCASIYSGEDFDYGLGEGPGSVLWIDNLDDACGVLQEFKPFFESELHKKIWHNYGFDRHVMWNEGIDCRGFGGDTMHMARLQDTSRSREGNGNGYSLEALTEDLLRRRKLPMKEIFGVRRLRKDGSEGSILDIPPVEIMQRDPQFREKWIQYSCYDAQGTYLIHDELRKRLKATFWMESDKGNHNLYEYYCRHMRPFGEVLTDMERRGCV